MPFKSIREFGISALDGCFQLFRERVIKNASSCSETWRLVWRQNVA
jgi:hypothetical protein